MMIYQSMLTSVLTKCDTYLSSRSAVDFGKEQEIASTAFESLCRGGWRVAIRTLAPPSTWESSCWPGPPRSSSAPGQTAPVPVSSWSTWRRIAATSASLLIPTYPWTQTNTYWCHLPLVLWLTAWASGAWGSTPPPSPARCIWRPNDRLVRLAYSHHVRAEQGVLHLSRLGPAGGCKAHKKKSIPGISVGQKTSCEQDTQLFQF